jgi:hypothetical protein
MIFHMIDAVVLILIVRFFYLVKINAKRISMDSIVDIILKS